MQKYAYLYNGLLKSAAPKKVKSLNDFITYRQPAEEPVRPMTQRDYELSEFGKVVDADREEKLRQAVENNSRVGKSIYDTEDAVANSKLKPGETGATLESVPELVDLPVSTDLDESYRSDLRTEAEQTRLDNEAANASAERNAQHAAVRNGMMDYQQSVNKQNADARAEVEFANRQKNDMAKLMGDADARMSGRDQLAAVESAASTRPVTKEQHDKATAIMRHAMGLDKWDKYLYEKPVRQTPLSQKPAPEQKPEPVKQTWQDALSSTLKGWQNSLNGKFKEWEPYIRKYAPGAAAGMLGTGGLYALLSAMPGAKRRKALNFLLSIIGGTALAYGANRYMEGINGTKA